MADAQEQFIPTENIPEGGGVSEAAREQLAEEVRKAASQQKQDLKDEKRAKKKDNKLADIIRAFIHAKDDRMSLLISRLIQNNVPVTFVLGILALNYPEIDEILEKQLSFEEAVNKELAISKESELTNTLPEEAMQKIDEWGNKLFKNASVNPMKHIRTLAKADGVDLSAIQLTSFMFQDFLKKLGIEKDFAEIQGLSDAFLKTILQKLHDFAGEKGLLPPMELKETEEDED